MSHETPETLATPRDHQRLELARLALLRVHKLLLDVERARYEKVHGRVPNNASFLQLAAYDPFFDWLRPMLQLVLLIDERTADKRQPLGSAEAQALFARARTLLAADEAGDAFQRLYAQALQQAPPLAVLARQVALHLENALQE